MPNALAFIGGGLLEGTGKGLILRGKEKRERALADLENARNLERDEKNMEGRRGLLDASNKSAMERLGLNIRSRETTAGEATRSRETLASEATQSRETIAAEDRASREKVAGIKDKTGDSSAAEKSAFDSLVEINKITDGNGNESVDWAAVADGLDEKGFGNLAKAARGRGKGIDDQTNTRAAEAQADAEVEEKASTFSTDASDFGGVDQGSRTRFRARRVREIKAELSGGVPGGDQIIEVSGTPEAQKQALSRVPVGAKVRIKGALYIRREGGFEPVGR